MPILAHESRQPTPNAASLFFCRHWSGAAASCVRPHSHPMTKKRIIIIVLTVVLVTLAIVIGYLLTRDTVRVTDEGSGLPISGACVLPIYPSFAGARYFTDRHGIARIGGFGLPHGGYGVQVTAAGYFTNFIPTYPTASNHSGWRGDRMDISL